MYTYPLMHEYTCISILSVQNHHSPLVSCIITNTYISSISGIRIMQYNDSLKHSFIYILKITDLSAPLYLKIVIVFLYFSILLINIRTDIIMYTPIATAAVNTYSMMASNVFLLTSSFSPRIRMISPSCLKHI